MLPELASGCGHTRHPNQSPPRSGVAKCRNPASDAATCATRTPRRSSPPRSSSALGVVDAIDSYSLSYEVGAQKPDPAIYEHAVDALGVAPMDAVMIGDRSGPDGVAVEHGSPTLLLPPLRSRTVERLDLVLKLVR